jgi:hypothetical protein
MKRTVIFWVMLLILRAVPIAWAQNASSTPVVSGATPASTPVSGTKHHKKKASVQATAQPTAQPTLSATASPSPVKTVLVKPTATPTETPEPASLGAINSFKIYDRINMPGDFRRTLSYAVKTLNPDSLRHSHTVFLDLEKVSSNKDDQQRKNAYARFEVTELELGGPRNPWILLAGTVFDQSGDDCKVGDPIEVAVDFKDVKIDYDGSKLGEIQKGSDIAAQVYEILNHHAAYQLILEARDQAKDSKSMDETEAYMAKAKDGYAVLDFLSSSR